MVIVVVVVTKFSRMRKAGIACLGSLDSRRRALVSVNSRCTWVMIPEGLSVDNKTSFILCQRSVIDSTFFGSMLTSFLNLFSSFSLAVQLSNCAVRNMCRMWIVECTNSNNAP